MTPACALAAAGSEGRFAPPINPSRPPKRVQRSRRRGAMRPANTIYVGRPTLWGNPFADRAGIGHARSVILYGEWLANGLTPHILRRANFSEHEIAALYRWHRRLHDRLPELAGRDLQCWCPLTSAWCHADVLLRIAKASAR